MRIIPQQERKDPSAAKIFPSCVPALAITKYVLALSAYLCAIDFE